MATMVILSPALSAICGVERCDRAKVSRYLWDYIKRKDLQDPSNRRQIMCDENLQKVMDCETISMFQMNVGNKGCLKWNENGRFDECRKKYKSI